MYIKKPFLLIIISALLFACSSDGSGSGDDFDDIDDPQGGNVSARINGVNYVSDNDFVETVGQLIITDYYFVFGVSSGAYNSSSTEVRSLGVSFGGVNFDEVEAGYEVDSASNEDFYLMHGSYATGNLTGESVVANNLDQGEGYLKVTYIDKVNQTISGEFNFVAYNVDNPNDSYNVANGVFNDVEYTIE